MKKKQQRKGRRTKVRRQKRPVSSSQWHRAVIVDYSKLLAWPNVERVGLGWKERKRKVTSRFGVKIYVKEKKASSELETKQKLPRRTQVLIPIGKDTYRSVQVPTDVVWHKPAEFCAAPGDYLDPVPGGALIGVPGGNVGTFACTVVNQQGQAFGLTAGHMIRPVTGQTPPGTPVVQPANPLPGPPGLLGYTATGYFGNQPNGFVDCALIQLGGRGAVSTALDGVNSNNQVLPWEFVVNNKIQVTKFGAATFRTGGTIVGPVPSIVIGGIVVTEVYECLGMTPPLFGQPGDSGALVLSSSPGSQGCIVGLLFATMPPAQDAPYGRGYIFPFERIVGFRPV